MVIPLKLVSKLKISTWEKIGVAAAFSVGLISMLFAIVRVIALVSKTGTAEANPTWLALWSVIEDLVGKYHPLEFVGLDINSSLRSTHGWMSPSIRSFYPYTYQ
jgi:hypothetical protein